MNNRSLVIDLLILSGIITVYLLVASWIDGYRIWGENSINFDVTGQIGDFLGGVVGTIISAAGFYFLYLTLRDQRTAFLQQSAAFERERLESQYFELIRMHRDNVNELEFKRPVFIKEDSGYNEYNVSYEVIENKKVFRSVYKQFEDCKSELDFLFDSIEKVYNDNFKALILSTKSLQKIDLLELANSDISYSIIFYGVGKEGKSILNTVLAKRYKSSFITEVLNYISLKPRDDKEIYLKWIKLKEITNKEKKNYIVGEIIRSRSDSQKDVPISKLFEMDYVGDITYNYHDGFSKYYGGHQFRLGHYYRHLFQTVKFINGKTNLSYDEKYEYIKALRAQLSTYEQSMLFINSLSHMGFAWEFKPEVKKDLSEWREVNFRLITKYNLIKNLPGETVSGLKFKEIYPQIEYEGDDYVRTNVDFR